MIIYKPFHRFLRFALPVLLAVLLCGCGIYNKEYLSETDYVSPIQIRSDENKIIVRNINELKLAVLTIFEHYEEPGAIRTVLFDSSYDGDPASDISLACKQTITENALCAYVAEDISYELYKVVTFYEAQISVSYAPASANEITKLGYSGELRKYLNEALEQHKDQLVLLADYSNYSEEDIRGMVSDFYTSHPLRVPKEPNVRISVFSGSGKQRLYEIRFDYGLGQEELYARQEQIDTFDFPELPDTVLASMSDLEKAAYACAWLMNNCELSSSLSDNTAYSALFGGKANSQGLSLAMVALCERLELDCRLVYGQRSWQNHYWDILHIDDQYYHLDIEACITDGVKAGFLLNDESMWKTYRWDMSGYPQCSVVSEYPESIFDPYLVREDESLPEENEEISENG